MNALLNWLDRRHNRLTLLFSVFTLSAWWILKNQIGFSLPLSQINSVTDLTQLSALKDATVITRWAAILLDHGFDVVRFIQAIHVEDWTFVILGILFCFPVKNYKISTLVRLVMAIEVGLNLALGITFLSAFNSTDTLGILNTVRLFAQIELIVSVILMIGLFLVVLRLSFHEYAD